MISEPKIGQRRPMASVVTDKENLSATTTDVRNLKTDIAGLEKR